MFPRHSEKIRRGPAICSAEVRVVVRMGSAWGPQTHCHQAQIYAIDFSGPLSNRLVLHRFNKAGAGTRSAAKDGATNL